MECPRRVQSVGTLRVSSIRDEYFTQVERDYEKIGTRRKLKRGVDRFIRMMNDPALQDIKLKTEQPPVCRRLITSSHATLSNVSNCA